MSTPTRLYTVKNGDKARLVEAANPAQAVRHVAADTFTCSVTGALEAVQLRDQGVAVEKAGKTEEQESEQ